MREKLFTKENFARLTHFERQRLMHLQMSGSGGDYGGGGFLPDDCSECAACGYPMLGSGMCRDCYAEFHKLTEKALGHVGG